MPSVSCSSLLSSLLIITELIAFHREKKQIVSLALFSVQLCSSTFISAGLQCVYTGSILSATNVIFGTNCLSSTQKLYFCFLFALSSILFCCFLIILGNGITLSSNALYCLDANINLLAVFRDFPSCRQHKMHGVTSGSVSLFLLLHG